MSGIEGDMEMEKLLSRAKTLIEALPYIERYHGKHMVIKYGGSVLTDDELKESVLKDIILMRYVGMNPIIVHGGAQKITEVMQKLGKPAEFIEGLRVTDEETMEIVEMVLAGKINKDIVGTINSLGGQSVGLSGKDGGLITAKKLKKENLGFVGEVERINPGIIHILIEKGYIPVISSIGVGSDGTTYNINADSVAAEIASAVGAAKLILLTDIAGIFEDRAAKKELISVLTIGEAQEMIQAGKIETGMIPKVEACIKALNANVSRTHIIDGKIPHALLMEIFTDKGIGTMVVKGIGLIE